MGHFVTPESKELLKPRTTNHVEGTEEAREGDPNGQRWNNLSKKIIVYVQQENHGLPVRVRLV